MKEFLTIARKAASLAAPVLLENFGKIKHSDIIEKRLNDFLTYVDTQAEAKIIETLKEAFPAHRILAEESGSEKFESDYQWIIDPLDGTKNYIAGIPVFAISIALMHRKEVIVGVIYDPLRQEMYHAIKGHGAFMNDLPIRVSSQSELVKSLLATGFPFRYKEYLRQYISCFEEIFNNVSGIRRMGAAAIDLAYVASGKFEGFWEIALSPWDIAAGFLLIREAGGKASDFWGKDDYLPNEYLLATNNHIHDEMMIMLRKYFQKYEPI